MGNRRVAGTKTPWWTSEQLAALRACEGRSVAIAMEVTGRSARAVEYKARRLGIELNGYASRWVKKEPGPVRPVKLRKPVVAISRVEYCSKCHAPVSNWMQHFERTGHRREAA